MGSAFMGIDVVGEGEHRLRVTGGPLHGQLNLGIIRNSFGTQDAAVQGLATAVEVFDEVEKTPCVFEDLLLIHPISLVAQAYL